MWKLNQFLSGDDEEREESFLEEESDGFCSLSPTQRMYAFAASLVAGLALMFLSLIVFPKPIKFALLFTFGNVLAVGSTAFLIGPGRQLGMMFDPARIYATAIYIGCVVLALICALLIHSKILTVFAIIFEICALIWQHLYNSFSEFNNRKFFWHFKCFVRYTYLPSLSYFRYSLSYIPFARRMVSNLMIRLCDTEL
ncbi:hypothetical protein POTOM_042744 [Populus tomentosa]|uniref:Vesicle transport protein n=1 Tax=Populus tomentosa TaxID=118781 RepID=A0A8X7YGC3_POPTO|nr:hypothetical protein POTOM_042744 [Populus tomentosa]